MRPNLLSADANLAAMRISWNAAGVEIFVHRYQGADAFEVEFVRGDGATIAVVTVNKKDIRPILGAEIHYVRQVAA